MISFTIKANDQNQRLDKFISKAIPRLPQTLMYKYIRIKRIKVNSKKSEISYKLQTGDCVEFYINDEFFDKDIKQDFLYTSANINIVYEDENIMLVDKPSGLVVHEDDDNSVDTLINRCLHYLYNKKEYLPEEELSFVPALCNRIDRNTAGIVIVAKNAESLRQLNDSIKNRTVQKLYLCVVGGKFSQKEATISAFCTKDEQAKMVSVTDQAVEGSKTMITKYKVIDETEKNSLVEVDLLTGRTHQIRAHMAHIGHPILGDGKYGNTTLNYRFKLRQQLLYSYKIKFNFEDPQSLLRYLNGKSFQVERVWFQEKFQSEF
ncbi:MAG: RluA family pseudouridine synthase [Oscillospiraceae bacterium]